MIIAFISMTLRKIVSDKMRKVLILDDEGACLNLAKSILEAEFHIFTALSLKEARLLIKENSDLDIIVCDQQLGDGLGLDFLCELERKSPHIIRILVTGLMNESLFCQSINESSLFRYIPKPYKPEDLLEAVRLAAIKCEVDEQEFDVQELKKEAHKTFMKRKFLNDLEKVRASFFKSTFKVTAQWMLVVFVGASFVLIFIYIFKSFLGFDLLP